MDYIQSYTSDLGDITLASDGTYLTGLWFDGQKFDRANLSKNYLEKDLPIFDDVKHWLNIYFSGKEPGFMPPIQVQSTAFRMQVWEILISIPYGQTMTYGEIAKKISNTMSCQAVGQAIGHNPISIIIPCHRVVGTNGSLTGYAGGIERKIKLLDLEGAI